MDDKAIFCDPQYQNKDFSVPGTMAITEFSTLTDVRCRNGIWSQMEHIISYVYAAYTAINKRMILGHLGQRGRSFDKK